MIATPPRGRAAGQQTTSSVTLTNTNTEPTYSAAGSDPTGCNTNDGTITVTPLSGLAPYEYSIDNGATFQSSNIFYNLGSGTYGIFMKDGNGCITAPWSTQTTSYADFQYFGFGSKVNLSSSHVCLLGLEPLLSDPGCGNVNFIEIFGGIGGTAPYTFSLDGSSFAALTQDGYYFLSPGKLGQQVFTTSYPSVGWDGTLNGRPVVAGTYVWMAGGADYMGKTVQRRGVVILIR